MAKDEKPPVAPTIPAPTPPDPNALMAAAMDRLATVLQQQQEQNPDKIHDSLAAGRLKIETGIDEPVTERFIGCKSLLTAATFTAEVERGKIVRIVDYKRPDGWNRYQRDGGLLPNDMPMGRSEMTGEMDENGTPVFRFMPDPAFRQYDYDTYWKRDLRYYVGRAWSLKIIENPQDIRRDVPQAAE